MSEETGRDHARRAARRVLMTVIAMVIAAFVALVVGVVQHFRSEPAPDVEGEIDDSILTEPTRLCTTGSTARCRRASAIERFLDQEELTIRASEAVGEGAQGAIALALEGADGTVLRAKWRTQRSAELTNEPINELAAHRLQELVLDEGDFVVPPAAAHCFPLDAYRVNVDPTAEALEGIDCVLGYLSYWLGGAQSLGEGREAGLFPTPALGPGAWDSNLYDAERFETDVAYRRAFSLVNLLTFLTANGDAHSGQFMFYDDPLHLFVVDSSMSFRVLTNPRMAMRDEDLGANLLAPAIPRRVAERIRDLDPRQVQQLLVLDELKLSEGGAVRVELEEPFQTDQHLRLEGDRLQVGLTSSEIGRLWNRVTELQRRLEDGTLDVF